MGYRSYSGGFPCGKGYSKSGGFTNTRTGAYVSASRAHQRVGQSFGGYAKAQSKSSGNYYMKRG